MADVRTDDDLAVLEESFSTLNVDNLDPIIAYCHGSATGNGTENCHGGIACYFPDEQDQTIVADAVNREEDGPVVTNLRVQYLAALLAIQFTNEIDPKKTRKLTIYTNDKVLVDSMTEWIYKWQRNHFRTAHRKPVRNRDILESLLAERGKRCIDWIPANKNDPNLKVAIDASRGAP